MGGAEARLEEDGGAGWTETDHYDNYDDDDNDDNYDDDDDDDDFGGTYEDTNLNIENCKSRAKASQAGVTRGKTQAAFANLVFIHFFMFCSSLFAIFLSSILSDP